MLSINFCLIESIVKDYFKRSSESLLNEDYTLNINEAYILFNCLAKKENEFIKEKLSKNSSTILNTENLELSKEHISILNYNIFDDTVGSSIIFDEEGWEDRYYLNYAKMIYKEEIKNCIDLFVNTFKWQVLYYSGKSLQKTYYPFHIAPLFNSIIQFESTGMRPIHYCKMPNLSLEQQFYFVIPSLGYYLIPDKLKKNGQIGYYFPLECDIYTLGERERKNCIPRLPLKLSDNLLSVLSKL